MSLIPSESLNFPDSFRANVGWRLAQEAEPETGSPKQEVSAAWPESATADSVPQHGTSAGAEGSNEMHAIPASVPESDARQLELLPKASVEPESLESAAGTAEMTALLRHFLAAAATTPSGDPEQQSGPEAAEAPLELSPGPVIAGDEAINGQHDSVPKQASVPNDAHISISAVIEPNRAELPTEPAPTKVPPATQPVNSSSAAPQSKPEQPSPAAVATEHNPVEAAMPMAGSIAVESPAQAQHILELIAAAVQRGTLIGQAAPPEEAPAAQAPAPPTPEKHPAEVILPPAVPPGPAISASLGTAAPLIRAPEVKAPAKIRITPRKIKPRAIAQPTPPADVPIEDFSTDLTDFGHEEPTAEHRPDREIASPGAEIAFIPEPLMARPGREELTGRRIAAARHHFAQTDLLLFTARERRNRWIGFGLSESAVLTALALLGRYGFTHRFPDPTVKLLIFILIFAAAAVAVALPIAFFRNSPERWGRNKQP